MFTKRLLNKWYIQELVLINYNPLSYIGYMGVHLASLLFRGEDKLAIAASLDAYGCSFVYIGVYLQFI
jgi:hypothetical protein